jgi:hypothetical protein
VADITHRVEVLFDGLDRISGTMDGIGNKISKFGDSVQGITAPFADLTKTVLALEAAIVTVGIAAGKMAADFAAAEAKIGAAFGVSAEEDQKFADVAKTVFTEVGAVENIEQASQSVIRAYQVLGDVGTVELEKITTATLKLSGLYETDFNKALDATKTLMDNFGLTSEQALDFIAGGFQNGLDRSEDFLESITEYSIQFKEGGADAGQFFSVLETGLQGGILGTDKAADAFKEFRIRTTENTDAVQKALKELKIDPEQFKSKDIIDKFAEVQTAMIALEDTNKQAAISVELFGTQFEDLGLQAGLAIDTAKTSMADLQGSIDAVTFESVEKSFTKAFRTIISEIATLDLFEPFLEQAGSAFDNIAENFPKALANIDFTDFISSFDNLADTVQNLLSEMFVGADLTTAEGLQSAIQFIVDSIQNLTDISAGIIDSFEPVVSVLGELTQKFSEMDDATARSVGEWLGYITQVGVVAGAVTALGATVSALSGIVSGVSAAVGGLTVVSGAAATGLTAVAGVIAGPAGLAAAVGAVSFAIGKLINEIPNVADGMQSLIASADEFFNLGISSKTKEEIDDINFRFELARESAAKAAKETDNFTKSLDSAAAGSKNLETGLDQAAEAAKGITLEEFQLKIKDEEVQTFKRQIQEAQELIDGFVEGTVERIPTDTVFFDIDYDVKGELSKLRDLQDNLIELEDLTEKEKLLKIGLASERVWQQIDDLTGEIDNLTDKKRNIELGIIPGTKQDVDEIEKQITDLTKEKKEIQLEILDDEEIKRELDEITEDKQLLIQAIADKDKAQEAKDYIITQVGDHQVITIIPEIDSDKLETISKAVKKISPDGKEYIEYVPIVDEKAADKAKKQLDQEDFADRLLQVTATLEDSGYRVDIEKFKEDADKLRVLEINADLDIADMEKELKLAEVEADKLGFLMEEQCY